MTATRTIREFEDRGATWSVAEAWAADRRYRLLDPDLPTRTYRKGRGLFGQTRNVSILVVRDVVHFEAWLGKPILDEAYGVRMPPEITIEPGRGIGPWSRRRARTEVNDLLERLGARPIVDATDPDDSLADRIRIRIDGAADLAQRGDNQGALDLWDRTIPEMERRMGTLHGMTLTAELDRAVARMELGQEEAAVPTLRRLVSDMGTVIGPDEVWTLNARESLGVALVATGSTDEGVAVLRSLTDDLDRVYGPEHVRTERVRRRVDDVMGR